MEGNYYFALSVCLDFNFSSSKSEVSVPPGWRKLFVWDHPLLEWTLNWQVVGESEHGWYPVSVSYHGYADCLQLEKLNSRIDVKLCCCTCICYIPREQDRGSRTVDVLVGGDGHSPDASTQQSNGKCQRMFDTMSICVMTTLVMGIEYSR